MKTRTKTEMKKYLFLFLGVFVFLGCSRNQQVENRLEEYLQTVHSQNMEDALYIIIPVHSCDSCREIVYRNLLATSHQKDIKIVFSGEVREALTNHYLGRLDLMGVGLLADSEEQAKSFGLIQEEYPMEMISFLDVVEGKVVSYEILRPNMVNGEVDLRKGIFKNYIN